VTLHHAVSCVSAAFVLADCNIPSNEKPVTVMLTALC